jgi:hypothetical protein
MDTLDRLLILVRSDIQKEEMPRGEADQCQQAARIRRQNKSAGRRAYCHSANTMTFIGSVFPISRFDTCLSLPVNWNLE